MTASNTHKDCFWCGYVYDFWREEACPQCGSRLETDGPGTGATAENQRPDYSGPQYKK